METGEEISVSHCNQSHSNQIHVLFMQEQKSQKTRSESKILTEILGNMKT